MRVKEIMDEKHPFIYEDELATRARAVIRDFSLRILPVTDRTKRLIGVVSRGDVMVISSSVSPIRVKGIMTNPKSIATLEDDAFSTVKKNDWVRRVEHSRCKHFARQNLQWNFRLRKSD